METAEKTIASTEEVGAVSMSPSTSLLADLDWLIDEIERGDHIAWDGDDFWRLLGTLRKAHGLIEANAGRQPRRECGVELHGVVGSLDSET